MTYKQRKIKVEFKLVDGKTFDDSENNILTFENMRAYVNIGAYGGMSGTQMTLQIWGLSMQQMAALSYRGFWIDEAKFNRMCVWADDQMIFEGFISDAYADYNQLPDVPLTITASMSFGLRLKEVEPFSAEGNVDIVDIITAMARKADLKVENHGVKGVFMPNPHFTGNVVHQIQQAASALNIETDFTVDRVIIWRSGKQREEPLLFTSPKNGLVGYPIFTKEGLMATTIFCNDLFLGRRIQIETDLPNASGVYEVTKAEHHLTSWVEGGQWHTSFSGIPVKLES
ncbi:hypothetical protein PSI23_17545 [Xenorhabdus sp. XENO-10]|uniref:Minor tail protein n=1 Tax=Xenorhabdus yunnanensis TaxID=3025878 RepID=A0ABT5LIU7_9GAMM|nr:hypothetical protein [Xenorhabdus yunnanensis]MDC9591040.1 hypothetical protein [Xenorhabdus yunnanensis]